MKNKLGKRLVSLAISATMLLSSSSYLAKSADTLATPGIQLQTILVNPAGGGTVWKMEDWGGQCIIPNSNWTTITLRDYYANGTINFEVRNTGTDSANFGFRLISNRNKTEVTIDCKPSDAGGKAFTATPEWTSFTISLKSVVDSNAASGFSLDDFMFMMPYVPSWSSSGIEFRNVTISSPDDERQYPLIKVNQVGYETGSDKTARVSYFSKFGNLDNKKFEIVDTKTDTAVYSNTLPTGFDDAVVSGERVHILDFSDFTAPGEYYIKIPNSGLDATKRSPRDIADGLDVETVKSVTFKIGQDVYKDLLTDLSRYFYFQRQGIDLDAKYAGDFARENLHPKDVTVKRWSDRNNPDAKTIDVSGGWYDAGDYGKYISPAAGTLSDLLFAYELFPKSFENLNLNIPETDPTNPLYVNAPGILSEMKWELDMLLKFEHESKDGSFYVAANYDGNTIYMEDTLTRATTYTSPASDRDLRSHQATAGAAAVLAHAYLVYKDIPAYASFAVQCLETSKRAWNWVTDPANPKHMSIDAANRNYTFSQADLDREMFWAAGALYRAVSASGGNASVYETHIKQNLNNKNVQNCFNASQSINYSHGAKSFLGFVHYLYGNSDPDTAVKNEFGKFSSWRSAILKWDNWGISFPNWGYWWGSNQQIAQNAMSLMLGSIILDGDIPANIRNNSRNTANHLLGVNPISFSYVSGHGSNSVMNIYSGIYSKDKRPVPYKVPPGYFTEGSNIYDNRHLSKFDGKCYLDSDGEYTTNENTIYGNAAMIFLMASVMAENSNNNSPVADYQNYLLGKSVTNVTDLNGDSVIDVYDLIKSRRT